MTSLSRREFLEQASVLGAASTLRVALAAADEPPAPAPVPFRETVIQGSPRERGRAYGEIFREEINRFLQREIYDSFIQKPAPQEELLAYAAACGRAVAQFHQEIAQELEGVAQGANITTAEAVLLTLHEELYHRGALPKVPHCTAVAAGPPVTRDARAYVGQTWDWMQSVYGLSSLCWWKRAAGPSVAAYGYPGLWIGAGLNSAGLALCWTSADLGNQAQGARVGIPAYVLLSLLLYQNSLEEAAALARRAVNAGWFTFVMADSTGNLLNIEGSPRGIVLEEHQGMLARVGFGSRQMTGTSTDVPVKLHARCQKMYELFEAARGKVTRETLMQAFADPGCGISVGKPTIDMMVFDCTRRQAWLSRGPSYGVNWTEFAF